MLAIGPLAPASRGQKYPLDHNISSEPNNRKCFLADKNLSGSALTTTGQSVPNGTRSSETVRG